MTRRLAQDAWAVRWEHFGLSRTFHVRADARMFREDMDLPGRVVRVRVTEIAPPKRRKGAKQGK